VLSMVYIMWLMGISQLMQG